MSESLQRGEVWQGSVLGEERLRVIEDRGEHVLVERIAGLKPGQHQRPFLLHKYALQLVFHPTDEWADPPELHRSVQGAQRLER